MLVPPIVPLPFLARHMSARFEDYLRVVEQRQAQLNRGASQDTIERNTFPHKYKRMKKNVEDSEEDHVEKCTICLSEFEELEDVR